MFLSQPFGFGSSGGGVVIPLFGGTANADVPGNETATAGWRFNEDGSVDIRTGLGWSGSLGWYSPTTPAIGASYFIRATLLSGSTPSGSLGVWLALSAFKSWTLSVTGGGAAVCSLLIEISTAGSDATVVTEGTYNIDVLSEP